MASKVYGPSDNLLDRSFEKVRFLALAFDPLLVGYLLPLLISFDGSPFSAT